MVSLAWRTPGPPGGRPVHYECTAVHCQSATLHYSTNSCALVKVCLQLAKITYRLVCQIDAGNDYILVTPFMYTKL